MSRVNLQDRFDEIEALYNQIEGHIDWIELKLYLTDYTPKETA